MASYFLVHGAWYGGWCWDPVREELEARAHTVQAPDLPCEEVAAGIHEYAAAVPAADVAVGHSLGGLTRQRHLARDVLAVEPHELDAGHSPMLERPRELAALLAALLDALV